MFSNFHYAAVRLQFFRVHNGFCQRFGASNVSSPFTCNLRLTILCNVVITLVHHSSLLINRIFEWKEIVLADYCNVLSLHRDTSASILIYHVDLHKQLDNWFFIFPYHCCCLAVITMCVCHLFAVAAILMRCLIDPTNRAKHLADLPQPADDRWKVSWEVSFPCVCEREREKSGACAADDWASISVATDDFHRRSRATWKRWSSNIANIYTIILRESFVVKWIGIDSVLKDCKSSDLVKTLSLFLCFVVRCTLNSCTTRSVLLSSCLLRSSSDERRHLGLLPSIPLDINLVPCMHFLSLNRLAAATNDVLRWLSSAQPKQWCLGSGDTSKSVEGTPSILRLCCLGSCTIVRRANNPK